MKAQMLVRLVWVPLLLACAALGTVGCESSGESCAERDCERGERCIQGACRAECQRQDDCALGTNCIGWRFSNGEQGEYCVPLEYAEGGRTGQYEPCQTSSDCDELRNFRCLDGACQLPCRVHTDCAGVGSCKLGAVDDLGRTIGACLPDPGGPSPPGRFGSSCPNGDECDAAAGFVCSSSGPGDVDAYCTKLGCASDEQCGPGMRCAPQRSRREPCEPVCGFEGSSAADCVPSAEVGEGLRFRCGPVSLVQNACVVRGYCEPCTSDEDCAGVADQVCADDGSGTRICTVRCDPLASGCPWGSASRCAITDANLGYATCSHRFGSCTGQGASCDPCLWDSDCGTSGLCVSSSFTGERFCLDLNVECNCAAVPVTPGGTCKGGGCPTSPGGIEMSCLGGPDYVDSALYNTCYGAEVTTDPLSGSTQTSCWPAL